MAEIRSRFGLRIVTEAIDNETLDLVAEWADVVQIGARNMQNFPCSSAPGQLRKPVMIKRGLSATLDEFLMPPKYVMSEGNYEVILCERGVRTFADHTRNTLDLSIIPAVRRVSHLPILSNPRPRHRKARQSCCPWPRTQSLRAPTAILSRSTTIPEKALSTVPSPSIRISSPA